MPSLLSHPLLAAATAIVAWSTSATAVGLLANTLPFYKLTGFVHVVAFCGLLLAFCLRRKPRAELLRFFAVSDRATTTAFLLLALLFSVSLTAYHLLFYYAMLGTTRIYANIANYLWPIVLYLLVHYDQSNATHKRTWSDFALLFLAFLGSVALVWDFGSVDHAALGSSDYLGVSAGFAAAICAGVYMYISKRLFHLTESRRSQIDQPTIFFIGLMPSSLVFILLAAAQGWSLPQTSDMWGLVLWLAIVTVVVAQTTWSHAISIGPTHIIAVLAYLIPVASTSLQVLVLGDQVTPSILFGVTFVVVSSVLTARIFRQLVPETSAAVAFMYMGFVLFFQADLLLGIEFALADNFPIQLFAILAAFLLMRQSARSRSEVRALIRLQKAVSKLIYIADKKAALTSAGASQKCIDPSHLDSGLGQLLLQFFARVVDLDQAQSHSELHNRVDAYRHIERKLVVACRRRITDSDEYTRHQILEAELELGASGSNWIAMKTDRAGYGEVLIILLLGLISILLYSTAAAHTPIRGFIAMGVVGAIAYIAVRVYDYNVRPALVNIDELANFQTLTERYRHPIYLGQIESLRYGEEYRYLERRAIVRTEGHRREAFHTSEPRNPLRRQLRARRYAAIFLLLGPAFVIVMNLFW
ncbi:DMT family transporter [Thiohalocapsa sp. ML1]|jgi:drug/metabolite transporter (DMT)-like permease|uniref:DMT family transporter n=1 Tax=Thiohalocapsa sp. ML1 TaxID=1431688 RepID=UPI0009EB280C|nr:DMT family transporter [Thiohalocapsa sp. ML1]